MIRKVYLDFIRDQIGKGNLRWLASRSLQYILIHASSAMGRAFTGPILGTIVTNYRCNYSCKMCDLHVRDKDFKARGLAELDARQLKRIIKDFAGMGTAGIGFTGGEPLLRKDIFDLLAYTKSLGMISHLNTNGYFLDDKAASKVIEAQVDSINISLDGARAQTHNAIRGFSGAFDRTVRAIGRMCMARKKSGSRIRIKTVTVIQEENIDEVEEMIQLSKELKVDCMEFIPRQQFTLNRESRIDDERFLGKVASVVKFLQRSDMKEIKIENSQTHLKLFVKAFKNQESPVKCFAGYNSLAVDCYGEIYPCVPWINWHRSVGNIRNLDLPAFWHSREYNAMRKEIAVCRRCYLNCQAELNILFNLFRVYGPSHIKLGLD